MAGETQTSGREATLTDLPDRIDKLIKARGLPWVRTGNAVVVELNKTGRRQRVDIRRENDLYIFRSVVVGTKYVTRNNTTWRNLARRAWRKNALKDLVTFAFDERDRLIG